MRGRFRKTADPFNLPISSFRVRLVRNILIGILIGFMLGMIRQMLVIWDIEYLIYDWRMRQRPVRVVENNPITLVMIDEDSLGMIRGQELIPLDYLADLVTLLSQRGARAIGIDIVLSGISPEDPNARKLEEAIRKAGNVVLAGRAFPVPTLGQASMRPPNFLIAAAKYTGLEHLNVGPFGAVRDGFMRLTLKGDQTSNAFAVQVARLYENRDIPATFGQLSSTFWSTPFTFRSQANPDDVHISINYKGPRSEVGLTDGTFPCFRAQLSSLQVVDPRFFRDKIVIIGSALTQEANRYLTPMGTSTSIAKAEMWTAEILANWIETILRGDYLHFLTPTGQMIWLMLIGMVAALLSTNRKLLPVVLFMLIFTILLSLLMKKLMFEGNLVMPYLPTLLVPWFTALGSIGARVALDDREMRLLREVFGRSVSPAIAQELVTRISNERHKRGAHPGSLLSEECVSSILFLDVANFTPLSEAFPPERLFIFTNELLDRLADCVFECKGSLIRYTGDGLIALFGRPIVREDHASLCCEAALQMKEALQALNEDRKKREEPLVQIRIGVNTGSMVVGLLGGHQRFDYSVLGNEVNIAARFEKLNKDFGTTILVGEATVRELHEDFICRPLGSVSLKGKTQSVSVYELVCRRGEPIPDFLRNFLVAYEEGYMAIRANRFEDAIQAFHRALEQKPDDLATQKLLARAEERTRSTTGLR